MELLKLLSDGGFHGGQELGGKLEITRMAVWKQIQKLQDIGVEIQVVKGKGYRLMSPLELMDAAAIRAGILPAAAPLLANIEVLQVTTSTNDVAVQAVEGGAQRGSVVLAERQIAGRGRRGRQWVSPFGSNLYLSCVWEFYGGAASLEGLSLAVGVAVVRALKAVGVKGCNLKWPNDILHSQKKIAGILLEMTGDPSGKCQVVVGIGINHKLPVVLGSIIDQPWTRLDDICPGVGRNLLAAMVISHVLLMLSQFQLQGFSCCRDEWNQHDGYREIQVVIKTGAEDIYGIADGVDDSGGLRLLTNNGLQIIKGGEMTLRRVHD